MLRPVVQNDFDQVYENLGFEKEGKLRQFFKRAADAAFIDDFYMARVTEER